MPEPFEYEPHRFGHLKGVTSAVCKGCGLLRANNLLTDFAIKFGCNWSEHPRYQWARVELVRRWQEDHA